MLVRMKYASLLNVYDWRFLGNFEVLLVRWRGVHFLHSIACVIIAVVVLAYGWSYF
jgi:hypothetical protein